MIEQVAAVVGDLVEALGALLGGDGAPAPVGVQLGEGVAALAERVGTLASELALAVVALLGGGGGLPEPATTSGVAQMSAFLYERATGLIERGGELVGEQAQVAAGALYATLINVDGGIAAPQEQRTAQQQTGGSSPAAPPVAPIPAVPATPGGGPAAPLAGYSSSFLGASGSSAEAFQMMFAILALFGLALLQGGKLLRHEREPLGPSSAHILAIERPG
jgi:hypothetical protein